jgi:hypothetical protein
VTVTLAMAVRMTYVRMPVLAFHLMVQELEQHHGQEASQQGRPGAPARPRQRQLCVLRVVVAAYRLKRVVKLCERRLYG